MRGERPPAGTEADPWTDELLAPQRRFAELHARTLRRHGARATDLSYANPRTPLDPRLRDVFAAAVAAPAAEWQYTPCGGGTVARRLIATSLRRRFDLPFGFRDVVLTPGAMAALHLAFATLFRPGDEVLLVTPCWMDYPLYLRHHGIGWRLVPARPDKHLDIGAIGDALGPRTAGMVISQPNCPTGVAYDGAELAALAAALREAAARHGRPLVLVSDEAHRDVSWGGSPCASPLAVHPDTVVVYSFGKAWSMQGQRMGYLAVSPLLAGRAGVAESLLRNTQVMGLWAPTALMQHDAVGLTGMSPDHGARAAAQRLVRRGLRAAGYDVVDAGATCFVYARSPLADEVAFVEQLADLGVLVAPSSLFHERGFFRISLNVDAPALERALPVLDRALASLGSHARA